MKKIIHTSKAPAALGPYSQAVIAGNFLFASGQVAINPETNELNLGNSISEETEQVMQNIKAVLETANLNFLDVVKVSIFLKDMNDFAKVNETYGAYFTQDFPARETVQVAGLPKNVNVEISVTALIPS